MTSYAVLVWNILPKMVNFTVLAVCPTPPPLFWKNSRGWPWLTTSVRCVSRECSQRNAVNHAKWKTRCCCFETTHLKFNLTNDVLAVTIVLQKWPNLLPLCLILRVCCICSCSFKTEWLLGLNRHKTMSPYMRCQAIEHPTAYRPNSATAATVRLTSRLLSNCLSAH